MFPLPWDSIFTCGDELLGAHAGFVSQISFFDLQMHSPSYQTPFLLVAVSARRDAYQERQYAENASVLVLAEA